MKAPEEIPLRYSPFGSSKKVAIVPMSREIGRGLRQAVLMMAQSFIACQVKQGKLRRVTVQ